MAAKLTPKQKRFVDEYLVDLNATQAAIRAGYSKKTARSSGQRMLTNVDIADAIASAKKERSERTEITIDRVVRELARLGLSDVRKLFDHTGQLKSISELADDTAAMIASIDVSVVGSGEDSEVIKRIKLWDKNSALDKLMKHLDGYAPEKHDHTSSDGSMSPVRPDELTDEQLAAIAAGGGKAPAAS